MSAIISSCGTYRYALTRKTENIFPGKGTALFVMLNPSTADATLDDPTIRRCKSFSASWDCNGLTVANLYALRATDPAELWRHPNPVGPENDQHLMMLAHEYKDVVCAWGKNAKPERVATAVSILKNAGARLWCFGTNKDGSPKHPLYIKASQPLIEWCPSQAQ